MSTDWIPVEVMRVGKRHMVRWVHPGNQLIFQEPFFSQTVDALVGAHAVQKLTPVEALADVQPINEPRGFIFHVSRCGSTLVSRSLAKVPSHRVIAEASPVNQLLLSDIPDEGYKRHLLKGLIHALCGTAADTSCIIKFTSWNVLFLEQILALFPATPWVFIYREPGAVLQSLIEEPPRWAANQELARFIGGPHSGAWEQILFALESLLKAPIPHWNCLARAIDYSQLPDALLDIPAHFGLELDSAQQEQIIGTGQYDSKQSGEVAFRAHERKPLPLEADAAMQPLNLLYEEWERIRTGPFMDSTDGSDSIDAGEITARKLASYALEDQRILDLVKAGKMHPPNNELLANIHRRRGDLVAAAAEYERLHAAGNTSDAAIGVAANVALFHAIFNRKRAPARMPETEFAPAPFALFDNFLEREINQSLLEYAVSKQTDFMPTELQKLDQYGKPQRSTLVTYDVGKPGDIMRTLVTENLALVCERLNMPIFDIKFIQLKIASYSNGDFFRAHQDNRLNHPDRRISFVYYFHQEPKRYQGGDLLLYDTRFTPCAYVRSLFTRIVPENNQIIFFPSEYFHEVLPVITDNQDFRASRFTLAGHIS